MSVVGVVVLGLAVWFLVALALALALGAGITRNRRRGTTADILAACSGESPPPQDEGPPRVMGPDIPAPEAPTPPATAPDIPVPRTAPDAVPARRTHRRVALRRR